MVHGRGQERANPFSLLRPSQLRNGKLTRYSNDPTHKRWYKTKRWRELRAHQLSIQPLCVMCEARGKVTAANTCDHVVPHNGDEHLFWNNEFQSLCAPCHSQDKQRIEIHGYSREIGLDGWPIDEKHPANAKGY